MSYVILVYKYFRVIVLIDIFWLIILLGILLCFHYLVNYVFGPVVYIVLVSMQIYIMLMKLDAVYSVV